MTIEFLLWDLSLGRKGEFRERFSLYFLYFRYLEFKIINISKWHILRWHVPNSYRHILGWDLLLPFNIEKGNNNAMANR